jgi:hypothetical protein
MAPGPWPKKIILAWHSSINPGEVEEIERHLRRNALALGRR